MNKRVLVVDDECLIVEGLTAWLQYECWEPAGADSRTSAVAMMEETFYPIVVTDLCLETEEEGLALVDHVLNSSRGSRVVVLSGYVTPDVEEDLLRRGVSLVLQKPALCEVITEAINALLVEMEREAGDDENLDLEELYLKVRRRLYSIPTRRFRLSADRAEDVIQEAWLLFLQKRGLIRSATPWLAGTVANLSRQNIARSVRRRETMDDEGIAVIVDPRTSSDATAVIALRTALDHLDDRGRALCELIGLEGLSYDEVSARLHLPLGSIGPLYIRAKQKLRKALSH